MLDTADSRQIFFDVWEKSLREKNLNAIEKQISRIIAMHPDCFETLADREKFAAHEYKPDEHDPFAHLALHSVVVEMVSNDTPYGLRSLYDQLVNLLQNKHEVQHRLMNAVFDWMIESAERQNQSWDDAELTKRIEAEFEAELRQTRIK